MKSPGLATQPGESSSSDNFRYILRLDNYPRIVTLMPRPELSQEQRDLGAALGHEIQERRANRSAASLAEAAGVRLDTLRKLEQGGTPTPGFFLVVDIARALEATLDELAGAARQRAGART